MPGYLLLDGLYIFLFADALTTHILLRHQLFYRSGSSLAILIMDSPLILMVILIIGKLVGCILNSVTAVLRWII